VIIQDDQSCKLSRQFSSKWAAEFARQRIYSKTGKLRPVVKCKYCKEWHLGDVK
jgi:hypothetical protein